LSDKTIVTYFQVVKSVLASSVSREGEELYPRKWNFQFIGLPIVDEKKQVRPTLAATEVEMILMRSKGRYKVLLALLAGTGLRIGEALALTVNDFTDDFTTIKVSQSIYGRTIQTPKTPNAICEIDIPSSLAALIRTYVDERRSGYLFESRAGRPLIQRNVLRDALGKVRRDLNLDQHGKGFHAFRRFRTTHLRKNRVPWDLEKFWLGHANRDVTDKYSERLKDDVEWRKSVAEQTGLGFDFGLLGLLGLPNPQEKQNEKAA